MIQLPGFKDDEAWKVIRYETPIFWELVRERSCSQCDHGDLTPVPGHDRREIAGVVGLINPVVKYRWSSRHGELWFY